MLKFNLLPISLAAVLVTISLESTHSFSPNVQVLQKRILPADYNNILDDVPERNQEDDDATQQPTVSPSKGPSIGPTVVSTIPPSPMPSSMSSSNPFLCLLLSLLLSSLWAYQQYRHQLEQMLPMEAQIR